MERGQGKDRTHLSCYLFLMVTVLQELLYHNPLSEFPTLWPLVCHRMSCMSSLHKGMKTRENWDWNRQHDSCGYPPIALVQIQRYGCEPGTTIPFLDDLGQATSLCQPLPLPSVVSSLANKVREKFSHGYEMLGEKQLQHPPLLKGVSVWAGNIKEHLEWWE